MCNKMFGIFLIPLMPQDFKWMSGGEHAEVLGSLLQASLLLIVVKMCFKFGGLKALGRSLRETWEQQRSDIHRVLSVSLRGGCRFCALDPSFSVMDTAVCGSGLPLSVSPAGNRAGEVESLPQPWAALGVV